MRSLGKAEALAIEMVAKLMAKRGKEGPEGCNALLNCGSHPNSDQFLVEAVVAKKLGSPAIVSHSEGTGAKNTYLRR